MKYRGKGYSCRFEYLFFLLELVFSVGYNAFKQISPCLMGEIRKKAREELRRDFERERENNGQKDGLRTGKNAGSHRTPE